MCISGGKKCYYFFKKIWVPTKWMIPWLNLIEFNFIHSIGLYWKSVVLIVDFNFLPLRARNCEFYDLSMAIKCSLALVKYIGSSIQSYNEWNQQKLKYCYLWCNYSCNIRFINLLNQLYPLTLFVSNIFFEDITLTFWLLFLPSGH